MTLFEEITRNGWAVEVYRDAITLSRQGYVISFPDLREAVKWFRMKSPGRK